MLARASFLRADYLAKAKYEQEAKRIANVLGRSPAKAIQREEAKRIRAAFLDESKSCEHAHK